MYLSDGGQQTLRVDRFRQADCGGEVATEGFLHEEREVAVDRGRFQEAVRAALVSGRVREKLGR